MKHSPAEAQAPVFDVLLTDAVEGTTIAIPDYGSVSVYPAIKNRGRLIAQQREANDALKAALEECGVKSAAAAEEQLAKREKLLRDAELARQEAELHAPKTDDYDAGAQPLADRIAGLKAILEREKALEAQKKAVLELEEQREGETLPQLEARISRLETVL